MGVRLGVLIYASQSASTQAIPMMAGRVYAMAKSDAAPPLSIEPQKVTRSASVYAVFAIE